MKPRRMTFAGIGIIAALFAFTPIITSCAPTPNCQTHTGNADIKDQWTGVNVVHLSFHVDSCWQADGSLVRWNPYYHSETVQLWQPITCFGSTDMYNPGWQEVGVNWTIGPKFGVFCGPGSHSGGCLGIILTPPKDALMGDFVGCGWHGSGGSDFYIQQCCPPLQFSPTYGGPVIINPKMMKQNPKMFHSTLAPWMKAAIAKLPKTQQAAMTQKLLNEIHQQQKSQNIQVA